MPTVTRELIEQIAEWKKQGYSDDSIMQYLRSQGYSESDIYSALQQAQQAQSQVQVSEGAEETTTGSEEIGSEELIEAIIEEKWQELSKDIKKIIDWKASIEASIARLDEKIKSVEERMDSLYKALISKVTEYDKHMQLVGGELKAMEKAFSNFLPEFNKVLGELKAIVKSGSTSGKGKVKKKKVGEEE